MHDTIKYMDTIDWIFFDIGGVLADESAYQNYRRTTCLAIASRYALNLTEEDYTRAYQEASTGTGSLTERVVIKLLENAGCADRVNEALSVLSEEFRSGPTYLDLEEIRPEAKEVLRKLARHYRLGIIANQPEGIREKLKAAGVLEYLSDCTVSGDKEGKPNPAYYLRVLRKNDTIPERSVMVDDNLNRGILPAKALGMTTIWFGKSEIADGVDYAVENLENLVHVLL